jgi:hypothetical protein
MAVLLCAYLDTGSLTQETTNSAITVGHLALNQLPLTSRTMVSLESQSLSGFLFGW